MLAAQVAAPGLEQQQAEQGPEAAPELLQNPLYLAAVVRHSSSPEAVPAAASASNPLFIPGASRSSTVSQAEAYAVAAAAAAEASAAAAFEAGLLGGPSSVSANPLFGATLSSAVSAEVEVEAACAPLLALGAAAAQAALGDPRLAQYAAAEVAAAEHAAAAVQLQVQLLEKELQALQQRLASEVEAAAEEQADMQAQQTATRARLAAAEAALGEALEEAAAARQEAAAAGAQLEQVQLLARVDSAVGRRQVSMLVRLLSCHTSEAEGLLACLGRDCSE